MKKHHQPLQKPDYGQISSSVEEGARDETRDDAAQKISVLERLIRTHPIWFLPKISRDEANEILYGKNLGVRSFFRCALTN